MPEDLPIKIKLVVEMVTIAILEEELDFFWWVPPSATSLQLSVLGHPAGRWTHTLTLWPAKSWETPACGWHCPFRHAHMPSMAPANMWFEVQRDLRSELWTSLAGDLGHIIFLPGQSCRDRIYNAYVSNHWLEKDRKYHTELPWTYHIISIR